MEKAVDTLAALQKQIPLTLGIHTEPAEQAKLSIGGPLSDQTKNRDAGKHVLVIGTGNIYDNIRDVLDHRGATRYLFDTSFDQTSVGKSGTNDKEIKLDGLSPDLLPKKSDGSLDIDHVLILSPADSHLDYIKWAFDHNLPVVAEKPLVVGHENADELEELLEKPHPPLYAIDWATQQAKPLLKALGVDVSFDDALVTTGSEPSFNKDRIASIQGRWLNEAPTREIESYQARKWNDNIKAGAGQLYDNGIHLMMPLAVAGMRFVGSPQAKFGAVTDEKGKYTSIGKDTEQVEEYVRIAGNMSQNAKNQASVVLDVGFNAAKDEHVMELIDHKGDRLRWDMSGKVTCFDKFGKQQQIIALKEKHMYDMLLEEASQFIQAARENDRVASDLYAKEQLDMVRDIDKMHAAKPDKGGGIIRTPAPLNDPTVNITRSSPNSQRLL